MNTQHREREGTIEDRAREPWHLTRGVSLMNIGTLLATLTIGLTAWVNLVRDVDAGEIKQKEIHGEVRQIRKEQIAVQKDIAVIRQIQKQEKEERKNMQQDIKEILKAVRK